MYIVMVASECAPVAKVGGLGDVVYGLSRELEIRGNAVEIILPKYDCMRYDHIWGLQVAHQDLWVPWFNYKIHCTVWFGFVHGRKCFFIEPHSDDHFFERGVYYGHDDDAARFAFFSRAVLEYMFKTGRQPDVIHCHDWQTGLLPVLLYEMYQPMGMGHPRVCYTLHNVRHQGVTDPLILRQCGLEPSHLMAPDKLGDNTHVGAINIMKGGIVYSNFVTTVSPRYAEEIKHTELGHGLQPTLHAHAHKFGGVLNGLDYDMWNPQTDPNIARHFSVDDLDSKYANKEALRQRLWLRQDYKPLIAYVGRLDAQKGVPLIRHALYHALSRGAQFVLLGSSPELGINADFWQIRHELNDSPDCHLEIGYDEELAHMIYAGADMLVVPSMYEPCGLTQMIALRYGAVPIVRSVGGLTDTVFDRDYSERPAAERNGYVFYQADNHAIESAMDRAIGLWFDYPEQFRELMANGMRYDYSWNIPGQNYLNIYEYIRHK